MIVVKNLVKKINDTIILNNLNIEVKPQEVVSIVGPSGAGKTTLLNIIGTIDTPTSGVVLFENENISKLNSNKLAQFRNLQIGFVFQFHNLLPEFTAIENICIPAYIKNTSKKDAEFRATELLKLLQIEDKINHKPAELSGGERQRVAVARALINSPKVVLADEPSGNLDSASADNLHQLFFKLRAELKQTFIIVTHNEAFANMADRKIEMLDGCIIN